MQDLHCFTIDSPRRSPTGKGSLSGLQFAVKDLISIKGHTSSFGHPQWRKTHKPAQEDSSALVQLLEEGAELVGTTKMDQLAYSIIGNIGEGEAPLNTKYPERFCGGSSSGSASAVAGGMVDFAIGSDTGGSIRIPAAACCIYGIRTTFGMVPMDGVIGLARSADVLGFFARTPQMLKKVTAIFASRTKRFTFTKIVLPNNLDTYTDMDIEAFKNEVLRIATRNSLQVVEKDISPIVSQEVKDLFARNQGREIWNEHSAWVEQNMEYLADEVQARLANCKKLSTDARAVIEADKEQYLQYRQKIEDFIDEHTVICLPILPASGPNQDLSGEALLEFRNRAFMNIAPSSITGLPQISAPMHGGTSNIGIMGPKYSDLALFELLG